MIREMVKIDENLCNGCGACIPNCHEGALQIIDNKARLISDLLCDGLGACLGHCPKNAITIEKREAEAYNEDNVMQLMLKKGQNTVKAHMKHLKDHNETGYLNESIEFLKNNKDHINWNINEAIYSVNNFKIPNEDTNSFKTTELQSITKSASMCPGTQPISFESKDLSINTNSNYVHSSELRQWPVQMHLINPAASYFQNSDILVAADCVAFAMGSFHEKLLKGKSLAIACPKLDNEQNTYLSKLITLIDEAKVNTITVAIMTVPCCRGLLNLVKAAIEQASRNIPVKLITISAKGELVNEQWQ